MPLYALILLLFTACSPSSRADYYREGEEQAKALAKTLSRVHSIEDLIEESGVIKKRFEKLTALAIKAEEYRKKHPDEELPTSTLASDMLQYELERLCLIEGARPLLIKLQKNPMEDLDLALID